MPFLFQLIHQIGLVKLLLAALKQLQQVEIGHGLGLGGTLGGHNGNGFPTWF